MLLRFRAANMLSFRDEIELSLIAPRGAGSARPTGIQMDRRKIAALPVAAVFGPNASGKTNLLRTIRWMRTAVLDSVTEWARLDGVPRPLFELDPAARDEASLVEADFVLDGVRYIYGFEVSDERVETEWLHVYPKGHRQVWFERDAESPEPFRFPSEWLKGERQQLAHLTRPTALFLTVAAQFNHAQLAPLHQWLSRNLWYVSPEADLDRRHRDTRDRLADPAARARIVGLLKIADLGITDIETDRDGTIRLIHQGPAGTAPLDFDTQESLGTHAWFAVLGPLLAALDRGRVVLVDELDSSLHPTLIAEVVRMFRDPVANPRDAQLICNLHDASLLGSAHPEPVLDRHEVWITEKRRTGESELYPLADASPRKDENLERGYLTGRYGGSPRISLGELTTEMERQWAEAG